MLSVHFLEFYDFPYGQGHKSHRYILQDTCWHSPKEVFEYMLPYQVPQVRRDTFYDGCMVSIKRSQFEDLKIVCETTKQSNICEQKNWHKHPIMQLGIPQCQQF